MNKNKISSVIIVLLLLTSLIPTTIATECSDCEKENSFINFLKGLFGNYFSTGGSGFTVTGITTDPHIVSSSSDLRNVKFIVNTIFNGGGQQIVGYISPEDFKHESGYQTDHTLSITTTQNTEHINYEINNYNTKKIYAYTYSYNDPSDPCRSNRIYDIKDETNLGWSGYYHYCFYKNEVAIKGEFNEPYVHFSAPIKVCADGECIEKTITDAASSSGGTIDFNDRNNELVVQAKWVGSLITGKPIADEDEFVSILTDSSSSWKSIDRSKYDEYENEKTEVEGKLLDLAYTVADMDCEGIDCTDEVKEYVKYILAPVNEKATNIIRSNDPIGGNNNYNIIDDNTVYQTSIPTINKWGGATNPMITFFVNAHWIGIKIPVGKPEIISVNTPEIYSGNSGILEVTVKNTGEEEGVFVASIFNCILTQQNEAKNTIDEGETETMEIRLTTGTYNVEDRVKCWVKVQDVNLANNYDTAPFYADRKLAQKCTPNEYTGENNCIYQCKPDGTGEVEIKCCTDKEILKLDAYSNINGGWHCEKIDDNDDDDDKDCYVDCVKDECRLKGVSCEINCQLNCWWEENKNTIYLIGIIIILLMIIILVIKIAI